ncbi:hypothetical protein DOY81_006535 [Sarcophaga bullata]|nr:hypothetical protein DOY81_006535 [Sarcophaga bullata]
MLASALVIVLVGGVLTSCITPEYQRPSGPGAQTLVPIIERLAKRRPVDMLSVFDLKIFTDIQKCNKIYVFKKNFF